VEAGLVGVELLGAVHVGHRQDDDLKLPVHACLLVWGGSTRCNDGRRENSSVSR
jgi:hypothetical protein